MRTGRNQDQTPPIKAEFFVRKTVKTSANDEITQVLADLRKGGQDDGLAKLLPLVYDELKGIADGYLHRERADHTLQATALVHEAYLRLADCNPDWTDRKHFYRVAAKIMRRILVNHALEHRALKRGGGRNTLSLTEVTVALPGQDIDLIDLNEVLNHLAEIDPQKASIVELRFFGGCTTDMTAEALGISTRSVERHWRFCRAWLQDELASEEN